MYRRVLKTWSANPSLPARVHTLNPRLQAPQSGHWFLPQSKPLDDKHYPQYQRDGGGDAHDVHVHAGGPLGTLPPRPSCAPLAFKQAKMSNQSKKCGSLFRDITLQAGEKQKN